MDNIDQKVCFSGEQSRPFSEHLIKLNDDFVEYLEINAFLSHAFASTLTEHDWLNPEVISGARRCSSWVQNRGVMLKEEIRQLHERYLAERPTE